DEPGEAGWLGFVAPDGADELDDMVVSVAERPVPVGVPMGPPADAEDVLVVVVCAAAEPVGVWPAGAVETEVDAEVVVVASAEDVVSTAWLEGVDGVGLAEVVVLVDSTFEPFEFEAVEGVPDGVGVVHHWVEKLVVLSPDVCEPATDTGGVTAVGVVLAE